jgi:hypothetical protein
MKSTKIWFFAAVTAMSLAGSAALASPALACGTGVDVVQSRPLPQVQNVSLQVSEMIERAGRLERAAASHEASANAFDRDADVLANRARLVKNQAQLVAAIDRPSLFTVADELLARADANRGQAANERSQAMELRTSARVLRGRAQQLARQNGGGWRGRPNAPTTVRSEDSGSITL